MDDLVELSDDLRALKSEEERIRFNQLQQVRFHLRPSASDLHGKMVAIHDLLSQQPADYGKANLKFLKLLREALDTPDYQSLKADAQDPTILTLHRLAVALWCEVEPLNLYRNLGHDLIGFCSSDSIVDCLEESTKRAREAFDSDETLWQKLFYWLKRPKKALFKSEQSSSIQGKTVLDFEKGPATVINCYGGSPTEGKTVTPEFLALLQAIQNNRHAEVKDPRIPSAILYTNYQDLGKRGLENQQSVALMKLNHQFADIFMGITLSKNSVLYLNSNDRDWLGAESFAGEMKRFLMQGDSLIGREGQNDGGFFFPKNFESLFDAIMKKANQRFIEVPAELALNANQQRLRGAYQEYVYSMLQGLLEAELAQHFPGQTIMAIRACKENIDRCAADNAKYLYTRLDDADFQKEGKEIIIGAFHAPALLVKDRIVHVKAASKVFAFMRYVDREAFRQDLFALLKERYGVLDRHFIEPVVEQPAA